MRPALALLLVTSLALPRVASAGPPSEPEPDPVGTLSSQGTRRGVLELGLGVLLTGAAAGLIGFGSLQFIRARERIEYCRDAEFEQSGIDPCVFDPPPLGFASAGLSWGFSLPLLVGAAMLFARGGRLATDARRYRRTNLSLNPWWQRRGGGASVTLRF